MKSGKTINNIPIEKVSFDNKLPWAKDEAKGNVTIAQVIILWWLNNPRTNKENVPLYFERNYVDDFYYELDVLEKNGYIDDFDRVTPKGINCIKLNQDIISLHKQGWSTDEDKKRNKIIHEEMLRQSVVNARKLGLHDIADRNEKKISYNKIRFEQAELFKKADRLSKEKQYALSNEILFSLLADNFETFDLWKRITINYRGLKQYENELKTIEDFISRSNQPIFPTNSVDYFLQRKEKAMKLLNNIK